ncbi:MAG: hypothetical protein K2X66_03480, partial [Cyanobacteria bacterium]|nr:hypothetical protein [Cyanobacteriota bacterium]
MMKLFAPTPTQLPHKLTTALISLGILVSLMGGMALPAEAKLFGNSSHPFLKKVLIGSGIGAVVGAVVSKDHRVGGAIKGGLGGAAIGGIVG